MKSWYGIGVFCMGVAIAISAGAKEEEKAAAPEAATARVGDAYTLGVCPVSGEKLGSMGDPVVFIKDGKEIRLCCAGCQKKFDANAEAMIKDIDAKLIADQESHYPATTCINSGAELKDGGVSFVVGNRLLKTCCAKCEAKVKADPASFLAKLDQQVIEAQKADYKATTCPISGKPLGDAPVEIVVANRLVKLCCENCKGGVDKDPAAALSKLEGN
jgi:hypothetical protein